MHKNDLKALLATAIAIAALGAGALACNAAAAQGLNDRGVAADRDGYSMHNGKRDPFTEGAHVNGRRDPFIDGANRAAAGMALAGMDRSGVSTSPARAAARTQAAA